MIPTGTTIGLDALSRGSGERRGGLADEFQGGLIGLDALSGGRGERRRGLAEHPVPEVLPKCLDALSGGHGERGGVLADVVDEGLTNGLAALSSGHVERSGQGDGCCAITCERIGCGHAPTRAVRRHLSVFTISGTAGIVSGVIAMIGGGPLFRAAAGP